MPTDPRTTLRRTGQVEPLEERVVMCSGPLGGAPSAGVIHHSFVDPPLLAHAGELEHQLSSAHWQTGLFDVRNDYGFRGLGQTVAVIDSGIAYDHAALGGGLGSGFRVVGGRDFSPERDADPYDDGPAGSHGTHVAGIVGADNGTIGGSGVAPGVDFVALRVFDDAGAGYFSWVEEALQWVHDNRAAFENPITTVNLSLGTDWNDDAPPSWAMLEDEFAQLAADGIFISVSAGNSFDHYYEPGLSYPAASPYVVPVMSTDDDGDLSYFSQRHETAIAAPGRWIYSTVPDYVGNHNGLTDDWATYSGTSMAAPYIAGASVLIREAMEFVGIGGITQETIYDHIRATADVLFDSATDADYYRLNLAAAIDALMPADDYGATSWDSHNLGTITDSAGANVSGLIGRLDDVDSFTFTAAANGTITFAANATHHLTAAWHADGVSGTVGGEANETFTFEVSAGQTYTVGLATSGGIGRYDLTVSLEPSMDPVDWGTVEFAQFSGLDHSSGDAWYQVQAGRDGLLTVEALYDAAAGGMDLMLYNAGMDMLAESRAGGGRERVESMGSAGEVFYIRALGASEAVDFRLANLVHVEGQTVHVRGTDGDDQVRLVLGPTHSLVVNDVTYTLDAAEVASIEIDTGDGADRVEVTGTSADEAAVLRSGQFQFTSVGLAVAAESVETVYVQGGGGEDNAAFHDSAGNDLYRAWNGVAILNGTGFYNRADGFTQTHAFSTSGGYDEVRLYDSVGDDHYRTWSTRAMMVGNGFRNIADHFERARGIATAGGYNEARMYDSPENNIYQAWATHVVMNGPGFLNIAEGFERTRAFSTAGGDDEARIYDTPADEIYQAWSTHAMLSGAGFLNIVEGFERTRGFSTAGGRDEARLYDTPGDDIYQAFPTHASLSGEGFFNIAEGFERTRGIANAGGYDEARLYDTAGDDIYQAFPTYASLSGTGFFNIAEGFERTRGIASAGGYDEARLYDTPGDDIYQAYPSIASLSGVGFLNIAEGFERTRGIASAGGYDEARLYDTAGNDIYQAFPTHASLSGAGFLNIAERFEYTRGFATAGGYDEVRMYDSVHDDLFRTWQGRAIMIGSGYLYVAEGFDHQRGWSSGGNDEAHFYDSTADDNVIARAWGACLNLAGGSSLSQAYDFATIRAFGENGGENSSDLEAVDYLFQLVGQWV